MLTLLLIYQATMTLILHWRASSACNGVLQELILRTSMLTSSKTESGATLARHTLALWIPLNGSLATRISSLLSGIGLSSDQNTSLICMGLHGTHPMLWFLLLACIQALSAIMELQSQTQSRAWRTLQEAQTQIPRMTGRS